MRILALAIPLHLLVLAAGATAIAAFDRPHRLIVWFSDPAPPGSTSVDHAMMFGRSRFHMDGHGYQPAWDAVVSTPEPSPTRYRGAVILDW